MKNIKKFDLEGKKVIIRCDLNVPMSNGVITNDFRIIKSLETIKYAVSKNAKVIILSHLGRIKKEEDKAKNSLKPVAKRLGELLGRKVLFAGETRGRHTKALVRNLKDGEILMLENTRYEDLDGNKESNCDMELAKYWASLGDIFIDDAFGTAHRKAASNYGIAKLLPNGIGMLMDKEIKMLSKVLKTPETPFVVILGGSKVSDKITLTEELVKKADYLLITGAMAFTFLKAAGFNIGDSLYEKEYVEYCVELLSEYSDKIILPIDIVLADDMSKPKEIITKFVNEIPEGYIGLDMGPSTLKVFKQYLEDAKTIFWNGPAGYFENPDFALGTEKLAQIITSTKATTIAGGGDTAAALSAMGYADKFSHVSTGGGASTEYLEGKTLPALEVLNEKNS